MQILFALIACLASMKASATLLERAPLTSGGTDYQAYYDDVLNITWLADPQFARTSGYDSDGVMSFQDATLFIASLNTSNHLGTNNWRLPAWTDTGTLGCNFTNAYEETDCGFNVDVGTGEMAHLFFETLGNLSVFDAIGRPRPDGTYGYLNPSPFAVDLLRAYWYANEYPLESDSALYFFFEAGVQAVALKDFDSGAWAVRDGNVASVPIPATAWLLCTGLASLLGRLPDDYAME